MNALATAAPFTARLPTARSCRLPARRSGLSVSAMSTTGDSGATHKHTGRRQSVSLGTAGAAGRAAACARHSLSHVVGHPAGQEPTINFDRVTDAIVVGSCLRNAADAAK